MVHINPNSADSVTNNLTNYDYSCNQGVEDGRNGTHNDDFELPNMTEHEPVLQSDSEIQPLRTTEELKVGCSAFIMHKKKISKRKK